MLDISRTSTRWGAGEQRIPTSVLTHLHISARCTCHARALPPELASPTPLPYRYQASADGPALLLLHMWQGGGRKTSSLPYVTGPRSSWEHLAGTPILRWHRGSSPASVMSPSPPSSTTAAPALHPLHPPPLPRAPYRLSPSSSTFLPTGQPLKEARGQAQPPAHTAPASPTPIGRAAR